MRAIVVSTPGGTEALQLVETAVPEPTTGQLRIRVAAAAVNPIDGAVRSGVFHRIGAITLPTVGLGWDVAGTVDAVGVGVDGFAVGDRVAAMIPGFDRLTGAYQDYTVVPAADVALVPDDLELVTASTVPLNALTADQALSLFNRPAGASVLVTGAAGAVGGYAVELAIRAGYQVTGLARAQDSDWLSALGATPITNIGDRRFDIVFDPASLVDPALAAVADGGRYVGVQPMSLPTTDRPITVAAVGVEPDGRRLAELLADAGAGRLTTRVAGTLPLTEAGRAQELVANGGVRGRWVLVP